MTDNTTAPAVNPADETIGLGPLMVRFLVTGDNSSGSVAAFEIHLAELRTKLRD